MIAEKAAGGAQLQTDKQSVVQELPQAEIFHSVLSECIYVLLQEK